MEKYGKLVNLKYGQLTFAPIATVFLLVSILALPPVVSVCRYLKRGIITATTPLLKVARVSSKQQGACTSHTWYISVKCLFLQQFKVAMYY